MDINYLLKYDQKMATINNIDVHLLCTLYSLKLCFRCVPQWLYHYQYFMHLHCEQLQNMDIYNV